MRFSCFLSNALSTEARGKNGEHSRVSLRGAHPAALALVVREVPEDEGLSREHVRLCAGNLPLPISDVAVNTDN